jgi:hypothetical protein
MESLQRFSGVRHVPECGFQCVNDHMYIHTYMHHVYMRICTYMYKVPRIYLLIHNIINTLLFF